MSFEDFYSNEFNLIGMLKNVKSHINVPSLMLTQNVPPLSNSDADKELWPLLRWKLSQIKNSENISRLLGRSLYHKNFC